MTPLDFPYRIVQRHSWLPESPWRILKPTGKGRPYVPLLSDPEGSEIMFRTYGDAVTYLMENAHA